MSIEETTELGFADLGLPGTLLKVLEEIGYESPSTIQARTIPHVLAGRDVVGQAQTGTGKTAAFALPLLARLQLNRTEPQVLVLTPTRELTIQVAEAFQRYASHLPGFHVLPVYGGTGYEGQLRALKRGAHVVVGTPGRLVDHLKRGTLKLGGLQTLVIDEADEMLRMGFIEDVEWILQQTPDKRQVALFSATMPPPIRRIANGYLKDPIEITIEAKTATAATIRQRYWLVSGLHKLDALTRILEGENFDGMIVFVRTKTATAELSSKLEARGFSAAPLSGDMSQKERERTVERVKAGEVDILVATDVAARGLDVPRISHVVNYDIPYDTEAYIHRIGRTGRAGRSGEAILFVAPRERRLLQSIERATSQPIELMDLPTVASINDLRMTKFKQRITDTLAAEGLNAYIQLIDEYRQEKNVPALEIAAALAKLLQGDSPLFLDERPEAPAAPARPFDRDFTRERETPQEPRKPRKAPSKSEQFFGGGPEEERREKPRRREPGVAEPGMETYRVEVGHVHGVKPGHLVGAIANESGLEGKYIGAIEIYDDHSTVDLPEGMPPEIFEILQKTRVAGQALRITRSTGVAPPKPARKPFKKEFRPDNKPFSPKGRPKDGKKSPGFKKRREP